MPRTNNTALSAIWQTTETTIEGMKMETYQAQKTEIEQLPTVDEIHAMKEEGKLKFHHKSYYRGYVSRKIEGIVERYNGKFGKGYVVRSPNVDSTTYSFITYYIEQ